MSTNEVSIFKLTIGKHCKIDKSLIKNKFSWLEQTKSEYSNHPGIGA